MKKSMAPNSSFYNESMRHWPGALMVVGMLCCLLATVFVNPATTYADSIPGGNISDPVVRAVDIAKPSVVRIITTLPSHLIVHLSQGDASFPQQNSTSQVAVNGAYMLQVSGTGAFITSQGDILTADHVVNPPKDQEMTQFLDKVAAADVAKYINGQGGNQVTADQVQQQLDSGQMRSTPSFDQATSEVLLSTDYTGTLDAATFGDIPASIHKTVDKIKAQSAVNQKDVAIVHAPFTDTPSIQLGDSSTVQTQDVLTIIGFPGNGDVSNKPTDLLTSSVNKINVSSIKSTDTGAPLIQVGGNVEQGDSGGPALDNNGNVVGIVSFGIVSNPGAPAGTSFLQASASALDLVKSLGLDTTPGTFQKLWSQSFTSYAATTPGHWGQAQKGFEQLSTSYPDFKAVTRYLDYARTQAKNEPKTQPTPQATPTAKPSNVPSIPGLAQVPAMALTVGSVVVVLLLAIVLFGAVARRNKKKPAGKDRLAQQPPVPQGPPPQNGQRPATPVPANSANASINHGMAAFGAPSQPTPPPAQVVQPSQPSQTLPRTMPPVSSPNMPVNGNSGTFTTLRVWPCGHMNRPNARFCSICGEAAPPPPPPRRIEQ
jgi:serine protease Do